METKEKQKKKLNVGELGYLNRNCFLVNNLNYAPYDRCRYCDKKFRHCLFLHYQLISLISILVLIGLYFLIEGNIAMLDVISIFGLVIVYGYFFNKSTEKIIVSNFEETKAKDELQKLADSLEDKVEDQTRDIVEKNKKMEVLLKAKSEFLDIASHQLRTPVSVICGTLDMFRSGTMDKLPKEKQTRFISNAFSKGVKLNAVINDILDASDLDEKELDLKETLSELNLSDLVNNIVEYNKPEAEQKKTIINSDIEKDILVNADKKYLEQAINNLIDNAVKYTPAEKEIFVKLSKVGKIAQLEIKDGGIGIPQKEQKVLFQKFNRASNAREMHTDGSGLGLFIVKKVINAHPGAKVWFESKEGQGTTFYVQLLVI